MVKIILEIVLALLGIAGTIFGLWLAKKAAIEKAKKETEENIPTDTNNAINEGENLEGNVQDQKDKVDNLFP